MTEISASTVAVGTALVVVPDSGRPYRMVVEAVRSDGSLVGRRVMVQPEGGLFPVKGGRQVVRDFASTKLYRHAF